MTGLSSRQRGLAAGALIAVGCVAALAGAQGSPAVAARAETCAQPPASAAYSARVAKTLASGRDVWGAELLALPNGPDVAKARALLRPLLWARGPHGQPLTASGVYYLPFAQPEGARGAGSVALHVADGSQVIAQHVGGRTLSVQVGAAGDERYGSCLARLGRARLADGYLPILETSYADRSGARYRQESFAARVDGTASLVSFVQVSVDTRRSTAAVTVRFVPSDRGLHRAGSRLVGVGGASLAFDAGAAAGSAGVSYRVPRGTQRTVTVAWLDTRAAAPSLLADPAAYAAARRSVVDFWRARLAPAMSISVPDAEVENAERALLVQDLELTWRYSVGNPYEEFSFPESVDVARVLAEQGFPDVAKSILRTSLTRASNPYPNWKRGERLVATAEIYRLDGDAAFVRQVTPVLRGYVGVLGRQIDSGPSGLLDRERYSSDIPDSVYGLHSQAVVWEGLRTMAPVWAANGQPALAATCRRLAARLERSLRAAVASSQRRLPDGSLFVPIALLAGERPYASLTEARLGSYWNLVMPYALASGLFAPGGSQAQGILAYLQQHGSRLLGLVRAGAYALYGKAAAPASGTDEVYGINMARFLADNDQADELVLSLTGDLAAGMTPHTFVSGEAASVTPLPGTADRAMYLPPNGAGNAAFLETLRLMLVHETRDRAGAPYGLQLAFATPRTWLRAGRRIVVRNAPTSFGPVSFSIVAGTRAVEVSVTEPARTRPRALALRLRLPAGTHLTSVTVAGRPYSRFDARTGTIELPPGAPGEVVTLVARHSPT